jgi:hypothetical protein
MKKALLFITVLFMVVFTGCAPFNFYTKIDPVLMSGDYKGADAIVEESKEQYKGGHEMLYYFDKGSILQMLGDYAGSEGMLEKADLLVDQLYTKSATKEITSFFSNDLNLPYEGENFEQVMINIMKCLDYMYADNFQDAAVEARKVNNRMNLLIDKYQGKTTYKEDAFARYLSALAFEASGNINDAYIDYKNSYRAYKDYSGLYGTEVPQELKKDLLRLSEAMGFTEDYNGYKNEFGNISYVKQSDLRRGGEFVIVVYDGLAPYKESRFFMYDYYDEKTGNNNVIPIAFPHFKSRGSAIYGAEAVYGSLDYKSFVAEDVNSIALKCLEERNGLIMAKSIARAVAKFIAKQAASNNGKNELVNIVGTVYQFASEQADTRSWRTLPGRFHIIRGLLAPGKYDMAVRVTLSNGSVREQTVNLNIKQGKKEVVPLYILQ